MVTACEARGNDVVAALQQPPVERCARGVAHYPRPLQFVHGKVNETSVARGGLDHRRQPPHDRGRLAIHQPGRVIEPEIKARNLYAPHHGIGRQEFLKQRRIETFALRVVGNSDYCGNQGLLKGRQNSVVVLLHRGAPARGPELEQGVGLEGVRHLCPRTQDVFALHFGVIAMRRQVLEEHERVVRADLDG